MSYIEMLRNGSESLESLTDQFWNNMVEDVSIYREAIIRDAEKKGYDMKFVSKYVKEKGFEYAREKFDSLDNINFREFVEIMRFLDEYEALKNDPNVRKSPKYPAGKEGEKKKEMIDPIARRALMRQIAKEMLSGEIELVEKTNIYSHDVEASNDFVYECFEKLGLETDRLANLPKIIQANFKMFIKKKEIRSKTIAAMDFVDRLKYYKFLAKNKKSKSYIRDIDVLERIFEGKESSRNIRMTIGKTNTIEREATEEKQKELEAFYKIQFEEGKTNKYSLGKLSSKINSMMHTNTPVTMQDYDYLIQLGYNHYSNGGNEVLRSGVKQRVDLENWKKLLKNYKKEAQLLYYDVILIPETRKYFARTLGEAKNPSPNKDFIFEAWKADLDRREKKGEDVSEERARYLKNLSDYKKITNPMLPIENYMKKHR